MPLFRFTKKAYKSLQSLDPFVRKKLEMKLLELAKEEALPAHIHVLFDMEPATHRLQIGSYRCILKHVSNDEYIILDVAHREDVYKRK